MNEPKSKTLKFYAIGVDDESGAVTDVGDGRKTEESAIKRLPFPAFAVEAVGKVGARAVATERAIAWARDRNGGTLAAWYAGGLNEQGDSVAGAVFPTEEQARGTAEALEADGFIEGGTALAVKALTELEAREAIDLCEGTLPESGRIVTGAIPVERRSMFDRLTEAGVEPRDVDVLVTSKRGLLHAGGCHFVKRNPDSYREVSNPEAALEAALANWPEPSEFETQAEGDDVTITGVCVFCTVDERGSVETVADAA